MRRGGQREARRCRPCSTSSHRCPQFPFVLPSPSEEKVTSHGRHSLHRLPRISHLSYRASPRVLNPPLLPLFRRLRAPPVFSCRAYDDPWRIFIIVVEPTIAILRVSSQILRFYLSSSFSSFFPLFFLLCLSLSFPLSFHSACFFVCILIIARLARCDSSFVQVPDSSKQPLNLRFYRLVRSENHFIARTRFWSNIRCLIYTMFHTSYIALAFSFFVYSSLFVFLIGSSRSSKQPSSFESP